MLERFYVAHEDQVRIGEDALRTTVSMIFESQGVPAHDAAVGADTLVMADLRGVESHGVSNMLRRYIQWYEDGHLNPEPQWKILRDAPGVASIDGDRGLGVIQGPAAMRLAIKKARTVGVGVVTVQNGDHLGAVGHHAMIAAQNDMVGVCMSAGYRHVLPTFAREPRLGTNPIAFAAPARTMPFLLFDAATSAVARNKIALAARLGALMEPGWVAGLDGVPITDAQPVPLEDHFNQLPLGSTREQGSHKGYGLGLMVETLCTFLSGSTPFMLESTTNPKHYFAAYHIEAFTDTDAFKDTMDRMLQTLQDTPSAAGAERVLYPGLPEHEHLMERRANGIPLHIEVVTWFDSITDELGLARLERLTA